MVQTHCKAHQGTGMKAQLQVENKSVSTPTSGHIQTKHSTTVLRKYTAMLTSNTTCSYQITELSKTTLRHKYVFVNYVKINV